MKKVNFRTLVAPAGNGADVVISLDLVREVNDILVILCMDFSRQKSGVSGC